MLTKLTIKKNGHPTYYLADKLRFLDPIIDTTNQRKANKRLCKTYEASRQRLLTYEAIRLDNLNCQQNNN